MGDEKSAKKLKGLVLFGDSVFFGIGASNRDLGCGRLLKSMLGIPVLIKSRNRDTSVDALTRIKACRWDKNIFSHVIIMFGNNDCRLIDINRTQVEIKEYRNNLQAIVAWFQDNGFSPLLTNLQPINNDGFQRHLSSKQYSIFSVTQSLTKETPYSWQKKYSDACEETAKVTGVLLVDIRTPLEKLGKEIMARDGLHPNDLGHRVVAETIGNFVNRLK